VIERVRKNAARNGTSIRLTYHLQRLRQLLRRSEQLLDILSPLQADLDAAQRPARRSSACSPSWSATNACATICSGTGARTPN
jgi:uncharacterized membrane protein YccC